MLRLTGRYGDGWYPTTVVSPQEYAAKLATVRAAAAEAGRNAAAITPALHRFMVVAASEQEARAMLETKVIRALGLMAPCRSVAAMPEPCTLSGSTSMRSSISCPTTTTARRWTRLSPPCRPPDDRGTPAVGYSRTNRGQAAGLRRRGTAPRGSRTCLRSGLQTRSSLWTLGHRADRPVTSRDCSALGRRNTGEVQPLLAGRKPASRPSIPERKSSVRRLAGTDLAPTSLKQWSQARQTVAGSDRCRITSQFRGHFLCRADSVDSSF